jgi:hypothetical protein
MPIEFSTFDPRLGEEFVIADHETKSRFSNLEHGFLVITGVEIEWERSAAVLHEAICKTGQMGFITLNPWVPGASSLARDVGAEYPPHEHQGRTFIAYFETSKERIRRLFELRRLHGGSASGEWCIGSCHARFSSPTARFLSGCPIWGFAHVLGQPEKIGCVLELAEMQQSKFLTKIFDGFDSWRLQLETS